MISLPFPKLTVRNIKRFLVYFEVNNTTMEHSLLSLAFYISRAYKMFFFQTADGCVKGDCPGRCLSADFAFSSHCASDRNYQNEVSVR